LYLLAIYQGQATVTPEDATSMIRLTPTKRLEWLRGQTTAVDAQGKIDSLLEQYERFLEVTNAEEKTLVDMFMDKNQSRIYLDEAYKFGDLVYDVLTAIGKESRFHRLLVV